jgi:osmotically-inducible protein OsmY
MPESISEQVLKELQAQFERDPWINIHKYPIVVRTEKECMVLDGKVEDIAAKRRAMVLAQQLVRDRWPILDQLRRVPTKPMEDHELRDAVVRKLSTEPVFTEYTFHTEVAGEVETIHDAGPNAYDIFAHINDGAVTLTGSVSSLTHQRLAEVLVWWVYGCEALNNQLRVTPAENDTDNEITDAVRMVLEMDPLVHAGQLRVGTAASIVHLDGSVASEVEKKFAVLDAWCVRGVSDILDRVEVHS